jgi:tetratricopeptide (TPR) repeat protein
MQSRLYLLSTPLITILLNCLAASAEPSDLRLATELSDDGLKLFTVGRYEEAAQLQRRVLAIWNEISRTDKVSLSAAHFNLAYTYLAQGKLSASERHARLARDLSGGSATTSMRSRTSLLIAHIHFAAREYAEAERLLRTALPDLAGIERATTLNDLGMTRAALGDLADARSLLGRSIAAREQEGAATGPDHGRVLANLALVCFRQRDLSASASLYTRAIPLLESASGGLDRLHTAVALVEYSQVLQNSGRKSEARAYQRRAKAIMGDAVVPSVTTVDIRSFR